MKQNKTKLKSNAIAMLEAILTFMPGMILEFIQSGIESVQFSNLNSLAKKVLVYGLNAIQFILYIPTGITLAVSGKLSERIKEIEAVKDEGFNEFMEAGFYKEYIINKVKITLNIDAEDYEGMADIYDAYQRALVVINEFEQNVSDIIKRGMKVYDCKVDICSKTPYKSIDSGDSAGCFYPVHNIIGLLIIKDREYSIKALHHEIGHFVDHVVSLTHINFGCSSYFYSEGDEILHSAYESEVNHLNDDYAKKNYVEFFAVAYEHKATNGDMTNLSTTNYIVETYLSAFEKSVNDNISNNPELLWL